jgi:hypothetical protein
VQLRNTNRRDRCTARLNPVKEAHPPVNGMTGIDRMRHRWEKTRATEFFVKVMA